jgi:drug/metabolite transporter (DMT)-like permease
LSDAPALKPVPATLYAAMGLMTTLWGMNFFAAKVVTAQLAPLPAAGLRSLIGAIAICAYFFATYRGGRDTGSRKQILQFMGLGAIGVGLNQYFFMEGMSRTSVSHGALIIALTPALVLVLAAIVGQERMTALKVAGLVIAMSGIAMLQTGGDKSKGSSLLGDALVFGAASSFATYSVLTKRLAASADVRANGLTVVTYGFIGSALAFAPALAWTVPQIPVALIGWQAWAGLLYMSLASSVICYIIYYRALESMPASRVSALSYLQPLVAIGTAIPLMGEPITKSLIAGGALILIGVVLAERG